MKVIVGMSGGVDSSVTALLLKEQGYLVEGLFMRNWQEDDEQCPMTQDLNDAKAVCSKINIPFHTVSFAEHYWDNVFQYFLDEYNAGRTPNPDVFCNQEIKFSAFLDYALNELNADGIATGHYAKISHSHNQYELLKGNDDNKDQSYFLYRLNQHQLSKSLFPLGDLPKPKVREIAMKAGFFNHNKKDSTGICFIGERKFKQFLQQYLLQNPGNIITESGETIAQHDGLMYYTIGQRQGIGIGGGKTHTNSPWYVADKKIQTNELIVVQGRDNPMLYKKVLTFSQHHWISGEEPVSFPLECKAKIRYRQKEQPCSVIKNEVGSYEVSFDEPQWAVTPGQSIVFYQNNRCLGGGIIQ